MHKEKRCALRGKKDRLINEALYISRLARRFSVTIFKESFVSQSQVNCSRRWPPEYPIRLASSLRLFLSRHQPCLCFTQMSSAQIPFIRSHMPALSGYARWRYQYRVAYAPYLHTEGIHIILVNVCHFCTKCVLCSNSIRHTNVPCSLSKTHQSLSGTYLLYHPHFRAQPYI